jgi:predicted dehydrogenase/nucleoside-diphosphate-sugar epimerase
MEPDRIKVGLVGAGNAAAQHARALRSLPFVEIAALADPDQSRAESLAASFNIPRVFPSLTAMAEAPPRVVHVLTPTDTRAAIVLEALQMGCHVFVEAPMAAAAAECDRLIRAARERGLVLSVNHSARMDPIVLEALERLRRGECGEVMGANCFRSAEYAPFGGGSPLPPHFQNGSYPLQDLGIQELCLLEAFLGEIHHADIRYYPSGIGDPNLVFDEWHAMVECARGAGHMHVSWNARPFQDEIVVRGTRGVMHVDRGLQIITVRRSGRRPGRGLSSLRAFRKRVTAGESGADAGVAASVVNFHEALRKGEPPPVPAEEGRRMIALVEESSRRADDDKRYYLAESRTIPLPRILVTGASGMLGQALVRRLLESGEPLRLAVRRPPDRPPGNRIQLMYGDLGDPDFVDRAVEGIDLVFHVGASMRGGLAEFTSGTVWGTRNVVDACEKHNVRKLLYVSSLNILHTAGHLPGQPVTEKSPYEPLAALRGLHVQTKLEAERTVLQAVEENRITAVVLRPGQIYGPGTEKTPPWGAIERNGRWIVAGPGEHYVPLVYIDNVVDALLLAAQQELPNGAIFQLVDPEGVRQKEYVEWVRRSGSKVRVWYVPPVLLKCAGLWSMAAARLFRRPPALSPYAVKSMKPLWPCDCTAAHTQLGWKPRYTAPEGLALTLLNVGQALSPANQP